MATAIGTGDIKDTFSSLCAWPTLESMEEGVRTARRAVNDVRHATEDLVAGTALEVRRHPLTAVGLAATAGLMAGCAVGFGAAWLWKYRG